VTKNKVKRKQRRKYLDSGMDVKVVISQGRILKYT